MEVGTIEPGTDASRSAAGDGFVRLAIAVMVGIALGRFIPHPRIWLILGVLGAAVCLVMIARRRRRAARCWGWLAVIVLSASWLGVRSHYVVGDHLSRHVGDQPRLAQIVGAVESRPWLGDSRGGSFRDFAWQRVHTLVVVSVEAIGPIGQETPTRGRLLLRVKGADAALRPGQRLRARGWLAGIEGPANPGEFDFRRRLAQRGIVGRLSLDSAGNRELLPPPALSPRRWWRALRRGAAAAADRALVLGLEDQPLQAGLLRTLLLGRQSPLLGDVEEDFRKIGLAHILTISGAHLAILMGLVWMLLRLLVAHPPRAAHGALVILLIYLVALPVTAPILRSAIMTGTFFMGLSLGRRTAALSLLALACVLVLVLQPAELFSAGFQLSFGIVAAMILFTTAVSHRLWPPPPVRVVAPTLAEQVVRRGVDYLAVSLVAFAVAMPVVAYHFQIISPHAVLLSILALPVVTVLLGLGYFKILVGLVLPSASIMLSGVLGWFTDMMLGLVARGADWPGAAITLHHPPSLVWMLATLGAILALLSGWFSRRRVALAGATVVLVGWTFAAQQPAMSRWLAPPPGSGDAATLHMFAVGDGSCFLLRWRGGSRDHTLMFDCGSSGYLDVGEKSIVPAMRTVGIHRVDTLVLSHADLDHFSGSLDLADAMPIGRVLLSPQFMREADAASEGAAAHLVRDLRSRGVDIEIVSRGWRETVGDAELEILHPPADLVATWNNDASLVLSVRVAGRRILLSGDVQTEAIAALLASGADLRADIADLPHHGSFVDASPRWLAAVAPKVVLQSSGRARLRRDRWADTFAARPIPRYITARDGLVTVHITATSQIGVDTFRPTHTPQPSHPIAGGPRINAPPHE